MSGSQKEKRGESPEALKKFPESYFNQPGLKQWWAPSVSATLWSWAVICNQDTEPWYLKEKVLIYHLPIITLAEYFIYNILSNPLNIFMWLILLKSLFWKWGKLRFTEIKPFNEASIAGELQLFKYAKKKVSSSQPGADLTLINGY